MGKSDFAGVLLAGGQSRRYGENKALTEIQNRHLIEYPAEVIRNIFTTHLLVTNTPDSFKFLDWPTTGDIFTGKGPLAGIHAAMKSLPVSYFFVAACDMPFLNQRLILRLCDKAPEADAVIPVSEYGLEPLHGIYSRKTLPLIEQYLLAGEHKIGKVLAQMDVLRIEPAEIETIIGSGKQPFTNINTPTDLKETVSAVLKTDPPRR